MTTSENIIFYSPCKHMFSTAGKFLCFLLTLCLLSIDFVNPPASVTEGIVLVLIKENLMMMMMMNAVFQCIHGCLFIGLEGLYINLPLGASNAQIPLCQQDSRTEERGAARCPDRARADPADACRCKAETEGDRNGIDRPAEQVYRLRQQEGRTGAEHEGMWSEAEKSRPGT